MTERVGRGTAGADLTVLTWNIHHGVGADGRVRLDRIARTIAASGAQVVALQEVEDSWGPRSWGVDQAAVLAGRVGMKGRLEPARTRRNGERKGFRADAGRPAGAGRSGNALLSALPVTCWERVPLAPHHPSGPWPEPRVLLMARVTVAGHDVRVGVTHLDPGSARLRRTTCEEIAAHLDGVTGPVILLGDMNTPAGSRSLAPLHDAGFRPATVPERPIVRPRTFPAPLPLVQLDQILLRGPVRARTVDALPERRASDHRPLGARLRVE